jgi:hypothetical protein
VSSSTLVPTVRGIMSVEELEARAKNVKEIASNTAPASAVVSVSSESISEQKSGGVDSTSTSSSSAYIQQPDKAADTVPVAVMFSVVLLYYINYVLVIY